MRRTSETFEGTGEEMGSTKVSNEVAEGLVQGFLNSYVELINEKGMTEDQAYEKIQDAAYKVSFGIGRNVDIALSRKPRENYPANEPGETHEELVQIIRKKNPNEKNWAERAMND